MTTWDAIKQLLKHIFVFPVKEVAGWRIWIIFRKKIGPQEHD
ncbi:MAG TPA: hypothetical protein PLZ78_08905 [Spirochaetota bacterium]|nr:hypothetical protein [Spirochaetota bacterium]